MLGNMECLGSRCTRRAEQQNADCMTVAPVRRVKEELVWKLWLDPPQSGFHHMRSASAAPAPEKAAGIFVEGLPPGFPSSYWLAGAVRQCRVAYKGAERTRVEEEEEDIYIAFFTILVVCPGDHLRANTQLSKSKS